MTKGFNKKEFMSWLKSEFPGSVDNHWNYDLVENIIDYAPVSYTHLTLPTKLEV